MKLLKKSLLAMLIILATLVVMPQMQNKVEAATIKISKTKKTIYEGNKYTLKVTGTTKKVKWRSLDKKIAKVNSNGKVTAKKNGKTTIIAKVGKKELANGFAKMGISLNPEELEMIWKNIVGKGSKDSFGIDEFMEFYERHKILKN